MKKISTEQTIRFRLYDIFSEKIETAVALAMNRAHKHTDKPTRDDIEDVVNSYVMNAICDLIDFQDIES